MSQHQPTQVSYASPAGEPTELERIAAGAKTLRGVAGILGGIGWGLLGLGLAAVVLAAVASDPARGWGGLLQAMFGSLGLFIQGVVCLVLATYVRMQAAVAATIERMAQQMFGGNS